MHFFESLFLVHTHLPVACHADARAFHCHLGSGMPRDRDSPLSSFRIINSCLPPRERKPELQQPKVAAPKTGGWRNKKASMGVGLACFTQWEAHGLRSEVRIHSRLLCNPPKGRFRAAWPPAIDRFGSLGRIPWNQLVPSKGSQETNPSRSLTTTNVKACLF